MCSDATPYFLARLLYVLPDCCAFLVSCLHWLEQYLICRCPITGVKVFPHLVLAQHMGGLAQLVAVLASFLCFVAACLHCGEQ